MFQFVLTNLKIIQYQILYYFLGFFAIIEDLKNTKHNKFGKFTI